MPWCVHSLLVGDGVVPSTHALCSAAVWFMLVPVILERCSEVGARIIGHFSDERTEA